MEREPFFVARGRLEKPASPDVNSGPDAEVKRTEHGVGSHVRVALPSGEVVAAEIVVIFTASTGKNILVSFDHRFMRIEEGQIQDRMSAKA